MGKITATVGAASASAAPSDASGPDGAGPVDGGAEPAGPAMTGPDEAVPVELVEERAELEEIDELDEPVLLDDASAAADPAGEDESERAPAFGSRREARERALSLLYEADAKDLAPAALLEEIPVPPPAFVVSLVAGVGERRLQIDELIDRFAIDWTIERMPVIDRTVVRMATFELLYRPDVPTGVVISEAVELAKRYSTEESGRFVNGVLASIATETRSAEGLPYA